MVQTVAESWTVARTAQYLGASDRTIRRLASDGRLSGYKVPGRGGQEWRIIAESAESHLRRKQVDSRSEIVRVSEERTLDTALVRMSELVSALEELVEEIRGLREEVKALSPAPQQEKRQSLWKRIATTFRGG